MPRFVLLHHQCPPGFSKPSHWDLMLEQQNVLLTWELRELPAAWTDSPAGNVNSLPAVKLADHRLVYLDFEGPLSDDRGSVTRYDAGTFEVIHQEVGFLEIRLQGSQLLGTVELRLNEDCWQLRVTASS